MVMLGALGGALPDIDAISMWSGFDATFGKFFHLSEPGSVIYSGKHWYSHHAFMHSLLAAVLLPLLYLVVRRGLLAILNHDHWPLKEYIRGQLWNVGAFVAGFAAHLLGDLPTPASSWGGIALLWPLPYYVGGWGKVWWWNNYDIFLMVFFCTLLCTLLVSRIGKLKHWKARRRAVFFLAALTLIACTARICTRRFDYASDPKIKYAEFEKKSKMEQEIILGKPLYRGMVWLDNHIPLNF